MSGSKCFTLQEKSEKAVIKKSKSKKSWKMNMTKKNSINTNNSSSNKQANMSTNEADISYSHSKTVANRTYSGGSLF